MAAAATAGLAMKGIFAKFAYIAGASVIVVVLMRMVIGLPLFWAAERWTNSAQRTVLTERDILLCVGFGGAFLLATLADFAAIHRLGVGISRIILFTYPLIIVLLTALIERRRPSARQLLAFVIAYGGLIVVLQPNRDDLGPNFWQGVGFGLTSAVTIATYFCLANPLIKRIGAPRFSVISQVSATAGMIVVAALTLTTESFAFQPEGWMWIVLIVVIATVAPMLMLYESMRRIGAARASLIALLGPVITVIVAWLVLDERLAPVQLIGFGMVLAGVALLEGAAFRLRSERGRAKAD